MAALVGDPDVVLFDLREQNEREVQGVIPGAIHAPRGMVEFWADPAMDIHRPEFDPDKQIIVHCSMGGRGALATATLQDMGFPRVANLAGGFEAWKAAGQPIADSSTSPQASAERTGRRL